MSTIDILIQLNISNDKKSDEFLLSVLIMPAKYILQFDTDLRRKSVTMILTIM